MNCKKLVSLFVLIAFAAQFASALTTTKVFAREIGSPSLTGTDTTSGGVHTFSTTDRNQMNRSDTSRYAIQNQWPASGYNDARYLRFNIPSVIPYPNSDVVVKNVYSNWEHRKGGSVNWALGHCSAPLGSFGEAKLGVSPDGGSSYTDIAGNLWPAGNSDQQFNNVDLAGVLNSASKVNSGRIRFLGWGVDRSEVWFIVWWWCRTESYETQHNLVSLEIRYNRRPTAPASVVITPNPAYTDNPLTCTPSGSADPDGNSANIVYEYEWQEEGATIASQTTNILPASETEKGNTYTCIATPRDEDGDTGTSGSASLMVQNTAPIVAVTSPNGGEIWSGNHQVTWTASDADGDSDIQTINVYYSADNGATWVLLGDYAGFLSAPWDTVVPEGDGTQYLVRVELFDGDGATAADDSDAVFIVDNSAPVTTIGLSPAWVFDAGGTHWYNADVTVTLDATDAPAGFDQMFCTLNVGTDCGSLVTPNVFVVSTEGTNVVVYYSQDKADATNVEDPHSETFGIDKSAPYAPANLAAPTWVNTQNIPLDWDEANDVSPGVGVCGYNIYVNDVQTAYNDGADNTNYLFTSGVDGNTYSFYVTAKDCVGWESGPSNTVTTSVDMTAPTTPWLTRTTPYWTNTGDVGLSWTPATDTFSGVASYNIYRGDVPYPGTIPAMNYFDFVTAPTTVYMDGSGKVDDTKYGYEVTGVDTATNEGGHSNRLRAVTDFTAPTSTATITPTPAPGLNVLGTNGWYVSAVVADLSSTDATSGVKKFQWRVNSGLWIYTGPGTPNGGIVTVQVPVLLEGSNVIEYDASDRAGNAETLHTLAVNIDYSAPTKPILSAPAVVTDGIIPLSWSASTDSVSGMDHYAAYCNGINVGNTTPATTTFNYQPVADGTYSCYVEAYDAAGNKAVSDPVSVVADLAPAFISVTSDKSIYVNGDTINVTAVMSESGLTMSADFSTIDSNYAAGSEIVVADGTTYYIYYNVSNDNTREGCLSSFGCAYNIPVTASDVHSTVPDNSLFLQLDVSTAGSLATYYTVSGAYNVVSAGIGLRPDPASKIISLNVSGAVVKAFLYWSVYDGASDNLTVNGTVVDGVEIGRFNTTAPNGFWIPASYRADVTALVAGSGDYEIGNDNAQVEGASLVVVYADATADNTIVINDGAGNDKLNASTTFAGFTANGGDSSLRLIGGGAKGIGPVVEAFSYFNANLFSNESWDSSAENEWDDDAFDVGAFVAADAANATALVSGDGSKVMDWVVAALVVKNKPAPVPTGNPFVGGGGYVPPAPTPAPAASPAPTTPATPPTPPTPAVTLAGMTAELPSGITLGKYLTGAVVDDEGNPVGGADVTAIYSDGSRAEVGTSDGNGNLRFKPTMKGWMTIELAKDGYVQKGESKTYVRGVAAFAATTVPTPTPSITPAAPAAPAPFLGFITAANAPWFAGLLVLLAGAGYWYYRRGGKRKGL